MAPGMSDRTDEEYDAIVNISASKRAAVDAAWAALARRGDADGGGPGAGSTSRSSASTASTAAASKGRAALSVLAKLNRTNAGGVKKGGDGGAKKKKLGSDGAGWMRALGVDANAANANANANAKATNGRGGKGTGKSKVSAAALEAAKSALDAAAGGVRVRAASRTDGVVTVSETRVFAGKEMTVEKTYEEGSREAKLAAKKRAAESRGGLDAVLHQMEKTKKLNVLDKSKMDWSAVKAADADVEEDLERHKKGKTYLEEQEFLKRAELREYEQERDARLAGDVRTRGRL